MYVCVFTHTIYAHTGAYSYISIYACAHIYTEAPIHALYTHAQAHRYIHAYTYINIHAHTYTYVPFR